MYIKLKFMFLFMNIPGPNSPSINIDVCHRPLIDEWSKTVVVIRDFNIWCLEETKFSDEGSFDMDYQWFSYIWDSFWLEHVWKISMSILYEK
jgi:hypothetical protein